MESPTKDQVVATTEEHNILLTESGIYVQDSACQGRISEHKKTFNGLVKAILYIADVEVEDFDPDERALTLTCAVYDVEAQRQEQRATIIESLCAQCEVFRKRTPFPND